MDAFEARYRAIASRDQRFDGRFFTGVTSTGIYCRPVCPARTPKRRNVRFYDHAAAAEVDGFRPCRRCRPETSPDSPEWDVRADLVGRALRLIADGVADRGGVREVAARLYVSERHLHRVFLDEIGVAPKTVARSRRARLARQLIDETDLPLSTVAFSAGFHSVRTFNDTVRSIYGRSPSALRTERATERANTLSVTLRARPPFDADASLAFLARRTIDGVDEVVDGEYRRGLGADALLSVRRIDGGVRLAIDGEIDGGLAGVVQGVRRLLDLDADPAAVRTVLRRDPTLRAAVDRHPAIRLPGPFDPFETTIRSVLGQQVSVAAASTVTARLVRRAGTARAQPTGTITHTFPTPPQVLDADLSRLGIPAARERTVRSVARAVADGDVVLDGSAPPDETLAALEALPGIGPWTLNVIAMRVLRDPDAFPASDLGVRKAAAAMGIGDDPRAIEAHAERWRPWRGYAAMLLWATLDDGGGT